MQEFLCCVLCAVCRGRILFSSYPVSACMQVLYCFNSWLGVCHLEAMLPERLAKHEAVRSLMVNPVLISRLTSMLQEVLHAQHAQSGQARVSRKANTTRRLPRYSTTPSTGLMGVALALSLCNSVSLFGFGNASDASEGRACWHYYDCRQGSQSSYFGRRATRGGNGASHNWRVQWQLLETWILRGAIRYHWPRGRAEAPISSDGARPGLHSLTAVSSS